MMPGLEGHSVRTICEKRRLMHALPLAAHGCALQLPVAHADACCDVLCGAATSGFGQLGCVLHVSIVDASAT